MFFTDSRQLLLLLLLLVFLFKLLYRRFKDVDVNACVILILCSTFIVFIVECYPDIWLYCVQCLSFQSRTFSPPTAPYAETSTAGSGGGDGDDDDDDDDGDNADLYLAEVHTFHCTITFFCV